MTVRISLQGDTFSNNTCAVLGSRGGDAEKVGHVAQCDADDVTLADNSYLTQTGGAKLQCGGDEIDLKAVQAKGLEQGSTSGELPSDDALLALAAARVDAWLPRAA